MSPLVRTIRTVLQVVVGVSAAVPAAAALFDEATTSMALVGAAFGAVTLLVTAGQNAYEARTGKALGGQR